MTHFRQQVLAQVTSELGPDRTPAWGGQGEDTGGNSTGQRLCGESEPGTQGRQSGQSVQLTARGRELGTGPMGRAVLWGKGMWVPAQRKGKPGGLDGATGFSLIA